MIVVFGSLNADLVFRMARVPTSGQTRLAESLTVQPSGEGANQAMAAARDGARVAMAGVVGTDALAEIAPSELQAMGVDLAALRRADLPTGCASICTDRDGRNQIAMALAADAGAPAEQVADTAMPLPLSPTTHLLPPT